MAEDEIGFRSRGQVTATPALRGAADPGIATTLPRMLRYPLVTLIWLAAQLPDSERTDEIIDKVKDNPTLAAILAGVGVLTAVLFVWGLAKQAFKAAFIGAALSAGAWYWYFNVR